MPGRPTRGDRAERPAVQRAPKSPTRSGAAKQPSHRAGPLTGAEIRTLQRTIGNQATSRLVGGATPAGTGVVQRKFSIRMPRRVVGFSNAATVDAHRAQLMAAIRKQERVNDADEIYDHIKTLATMGDDLGTGTWEQLIQVADSDLDTLYDDEPPAKRQRREETQDVEEEDEEDEEEEQEEEEEDEDIGGSIDMSPMVRLGSWNPEKYGKGTKAKKREAKKSHILNVLDTYNPAFLGLMEISDAAFLMEGSARKPGIRNASVPFYDEKGIQSLKRRREFTKTKRAGNLGYKPSDTYGASKGPRFESGGYGENYPAMYNTSQLVGAPTSFTVDLDSGQRTPFDPSAADQQPISFSSADKVNRRLVVWKLRFNASPWSLRPVYDREIPVVDMYVGVVHTSPSIDIRAEIRRVLDIARKISNDDKIPMVIVGDFYMQRSAKAIWDSLHNGSEPHWQIVHPTENTNFPHKGEGQIADHSVFDPRAFTNPSSFSVPPLPDSLQPISHLPEDVDLKEYEKYYRAMGADHTTVVNDFILNLRAYPQTTHTERRPDQRQ